MYKFFVNRVTIENSKKRYGRQTSVDGLAGSRSVGKATYQRQINSMPLNHISRQLHILEHNNFQKSKLYTIVNTPHYFYRNKSGPLTDLNVFHS
jgi:hypothetical protein